MKYQKYWNEIQVLYQNNNLTYKAINEHKELPTRGWIYQLFGNKKTIIDSIENNYNYKQALHRKSAYKNKHYNPVKVESKLYDMAEKGELSKKNIDADDELPTYNWIWRHFGKLSKFRKIVMGDDICKDCMYNPDTCNKTPEMCKQEYKEIMGVE